MGRLNAFRRGRRVALRLDGRRLLRDHDQVPAKRRLDRIGDREERQRKRRLFKLGHHTTARKLAQIAALLLGRAVALRLGEFCKLRLERIALQAIHLLLERLDVDLGALRLLLRFGIVRLDLLQRGIDLLRIDLDFRHDFLLQQFLNQNTVRKFLQPTLLAQRKLFRRLGHGLRRVRLAGVRLDEIGFALRTVFGGNLHALLGRLALEQGLHEELLRNLKREHLTRFFHLFGGNLILADFQQFVHVAADRAVRQLLAVDDQHDLVRIARGRLALRRRRLRLFLATAGAADSKRHGQSHRHATKHDTLHLVRLLG